VSGESLRRLDTEIAAEKAAALGRAGERLEQALAEAAALAGALRGAALDAASRARVLAEYTAARGRAQRARAALLIQREALGLGHHAVVDQQFPEPPRLPR
jgi:hypothetical protein